MGRHNGRVVVTDGRGPYLKVTLLRGFCEVDRPNAGPYKWSLYLGTDEARTAYCSAA